jgi:FtsH-binding integral membrane protein
MTNSEKVILALIVFIAFMGGNLLGLVANEPMTQFGKLLIVGSITFMGVVLVSVVWASR